MIWRRTKKLLAGFGVLSVFALSAAMAVNHLGGGRLLSVQSGSMMPTLKKGDLVSVKRVPESSIRVGDIITFINPRDKRTTVTHRVVTLSPHAANGNTVITKGDANAGPDIPIEASSIVGRVERHVPYAGHAVDFLRTWPGLVVLIYLPALLVIIAELKRLVAYYRSQQPYVLAGYEPHRKAVAGQKVFAGVKAVVFALVLSLMFALPTKAALQRTASLSGNTISVSAGNPDPPIDNGCTITNTGPNSTNTCTHQTTTTCSVTNDTNVNVSNSSNQTATTGNVIYQNNTSRPSSESVTSGSANTSSSTSTTVTVTDNTSTCSTNTP